MKLSEIRGENAMDVLADILEPAGVIMSDKEVADGIRNIVKKTGERSNKNRMKTVSMILRKYKREVIQILAATEQKSVDEYIKEVNVISLPLKLLEVFNDEELMSFFSPQEQTTSEKYSGSATENTEENKPIS